MSELVNLNKIRSIPDMSITQNGTPQIFTGLSHAEVLALEFPPERLLIENLIPIGAVGTIAGVPETYKSWQAQTIAISIAHGEGNVFDYPVTHQGPVGYFWQDDSTREEAERIKLYHNVKNTPEDLPLRWYLNEGLRLPDHTDRLLATIEQGNLVLVVLDSFYNILFGKDLKDEQAEQAIAMLKADICDQTNCTILIVDHMPWATDSNRQRLRSYGGVFKGAATRFGIYIDAVRNKLYVEARGNNITGFKRQPAEWDADTLELRLTGTNDEIGDEEYQQRVLNYLAEHPDSPTGDLSGKAKKIKGTNTRLLAARKELEGQNAIVRHRDRTTDGVYLWNLSIHGENDSSTPQTNTPELQPLFDGSDSSPLRGDEQNELSDPFIEPPPIDVYDPAVQAQLGDDDIPF